MVLLLSILTPLLGLYTALRSTDSLLVTCPKLYKKDDILERVFGTFSFSSTPLLSRMSPPLRRDLGDSNNNPNKVLDIIFIGMLFLKIFKKFTV